MAMAARYREKKLVAHRATLETARHWYDVNSKRGRTAAAARNKAQIHHEIPLVKKWERYVDQARAKMRGLADQIHKLKPVPPPVPQGEGWSVPKTAWNPYRRKIANWIVREIHDAVTNHGAQGVVTSGVRTYAEQKRLWEIYQHGGNIAAYPGTSNHEGYVYTRGAVDWSNPSSLHTALTRKASHKLIWAETVGLRDTVHFSGTGR